MTDKPHTPSTAEVCDAWEHHSDWSISNFDRWLYQVRAEAKAEALRDAASIKLGNGYYEMLVEDELNTRADRIEGTASDEND